MVKPKLIPIQCKRKRQKVLYAKKQGIFSRADEISILCGVEALVCIIDDKKNIYLYSSRQNYLNTVDKIISKEGCLLKHYSRGDFFEEEIGRGIEFKHYKVYDSLTTTEKFREALTLNTSVIEESVDGTNKSPYSIQDDSLSKCLSNLTSLNNRKNNKVHTSRCTKSTKSSITKKPIESVQNQKVSQNNESLIDQSKFRISLHEDSSSVICSNSLCHTITQSWDSYRFDNNLELLGRDQQPNNIGLLQFKRRFSSVDSQEINIINSPRDHENFLDLFNG